MHSIAGQGGDSMATKEILSTFVDDGRVSTAAVVPDPHGPLPFDLDESQIYCFEPLSKKSATAYLRYAFSPIKAVRRALQEYEPDVVVIRMHPLGTIPPLLSVLNGTPYILLSRGTSYKSLRYARVLRQLYKVNARLAAEVYSASYEIKQDTDRARTKSQPESKLVPNGINPDKFEPKSKLQMRDMLDLGFDDDFVVGFVGSMGPRHTLDTLIRSLDKIDDLPVKLLLVGDGPELDSHKRLVKENNLSGRVTFTGFVPHAEVDKYISACDITYGVTQQDSATPIKCFEYLACERPLIVRDIPEMEFVAEKNVGTLVSEIQEDNIADAIRRLYDVGEQKRNEMGERGREYVLKNHTWNAFVDEVVEYLSGRS